MCVDYLVLNVFVLLWRVFYISEGTKQYAQMVKDYYLKGNNLYLSYCLVLHCCYCRLN